MQRYKAETHRETGQCRREQEDASACASVLYTSSCQPDNTLTGWQHTGASPSPEHDHCMDACSLVVAQKSQQPLDAM